MCLQLVQLGCVREDAMLKYNPWEVCGMAVDTSCDISEVRKAAGDSDHSDLPKLVRPE